MAFELDAQAQIICMCHGKVTYKAIDVGLELSYEYDAEGVKLYVFKPSSRTVIKLYGINFMYSTIA